MGAYAIEAARHLHEQILTMYAATEAPKESAEIWHMIGITPMIGRNDVVAEVFQTSDADQVRDFARKTGIGLLSFWSLNRDHPCERPQEEATPLCSGIPQSAYEFTRLFRSFEVPSE